MEYSKKIKLLREKMFVSQKELAMYLFQNKQELIALKGQSILVKTNHKGLEFSFEVE